MSVVKKEVKALKKLLKNQKYEECRAKCQVYFIVISYQLQLTAARHKRGTAQ